MVKRLNKGKTLKHKTKSSLMRKKSAPVASVLPTVPELPKIEPIATTSLGGEWSEGGELEWPEIGGELEWPEIGGEMNGSMSIIIVIIIIIAIVIAGYFGYTYFFKQSFVIANAGGIPTQYNFKPTYGHHVLYNENHGLGVPFFTEATNPNKYRLNTADEYQGSILTSPGVEEKEIQAQKWRAMQMPTNGMLRGKICSTGLMEMDKKIPLTGNIDLPRSQGVINKAQNLLCGTKDIVHAHEVPMGHDMTLEYAKMGYQNIKNGELNNYKKVKSLMTNIRQDPTEINDFDNKVQDIISKGTSQ